MDILNKIKKCGIVPVVVLNDLEDANPLAESFLKSGINVAEITFRTDIAKDVIKNMSENYPEMIVGAGTVITLDQLETAIEAGAKFIVSPGFDSKIVKRSKELNVPIFPGAVTPSEIINAINSDLNTVKFFPAGNYGGIKTIESLSSPFNNIQFIPTGGINLDNIEDYISNDKIIAVGGSWLCPKELIKEKNFDKITEICKKSKYIVDKVRSK